ncbi:hypothetical protein [Allohahella marinimesophila]|uniref:Transposase n=1 Tax=Allohahella marinimesophila TaxID=1054972 RepID=A0ABP7PYS1_9GAMM
MAKHLSRSDIKKIVSLIRGWDQQKITWPAICEVVEPHIGKHPTRQTLNAHQAIVEAYQARKAALKNEGVAKRRPASLSIAASRIANLEAEVRELKEQNRLYKQMFTVWQYNAYKRGLSESQLNEPLPRVDRERTDGETR